MTSISPNLRQQVRERANGRCEYCRRPDTPGSQKHHVDHIIAIKQGGETSFENLAWACVKCNTSKGPNIAALDEDSGQLTPLFNSRTQRWNDHFDMDGTLIVGKTAIGGVTVRILQINHPDQLEARRQLIEVGAW